MDLTSRTELAWDISTLKCSLDREKPKQHFDTKALGKAKKGKVLQGVVTTHFSARSFHQGYIK